MKNGGVRPDGTRCSIHNFGSRKRYTPASIEEYKAIKAIPVQKENAIPDADDGEKYEWVKVGSYTKGGQSWEGGASPEEDGASYSFGRFFCSMYCLKTKQRRGETMGEFYENSTVD